MTTDFTNIDILLEHITSLLTNRLDQLLREQLGVGYSQYKVLLLFTGENIIRQKTIAKSLGQTEASISRQLKIITLKGLITRAYDPNNTKTKIVTLTLLGQRIRLAAKDIVSVETKTIFNIGNSKNLQLLISGLETLHTCLCDTINHSHNL